MNPRDLTDAHVRALLDPPGSWENRWQPDLMPGDWGHAYEAGLVGWSEGTGAFVTFNGKTIITEAQHIADGLSDEQAETLSLAGHGSSPMRFVMQSAKWGSQMTALVDGMRALGLMDNCPISDRPRCTPAGRLVLALRERIQAGREAGSRLPDADAACERWESEKDER